MSDLPEKPDLPEKSGLPEKLPAPSSAAGVPCPHCEKSPALCVCDSLHRQHNRVHVAILQHPQEPDKELGSARLTTLILDNSSLKTGLSCANLKSITGFDVDPSRWLVLFLGAQYKFRALQQRKDLSGIVLFDKNDEEIDYPLDQIDGIVALDGTWAQAKTLWWRNPWLLKLKRAVIFPRQASLYGRLRQEPRKECVSTIESIAYTLEVLGESPDVSQELLSAFRRLLQKYRDLHPNASARKPGAHGAGSGAKPGARRGAPRGRRTPKAGV